jgi:hypothetical protein
MITPPKTNELRTVAVEKNTWILELPEELCAKEGFAPGTLASLTIKDGAILGTFIPRTDEARTAVDRFSESYGDFMRQMKDID